MVWSHDDLNGKTARKLWAGSCLIFSCGGQVHGSTENDYNSEDLETNLSIGQEGALNQGHGQYPTAWWLLSCLSKVH